PLIATKICPVILCGGAGRRLYPLSTVQQPKQFLKLFGDLSLFQQAFRRVNHLNPWIVTSENYLATIQEQLSILNFEPSKILLEKEPKGTALAMMMAALIASQLDPTMIMAFFPSDHLILQEDEFMKSLERAYTLADEGAIVLTGITPTYADPNFGYIMAEEGGDVTSFMEKPPLALIPRFIEQGGLWNSGIYVFRVETFLCEMQKHAPDLYLTAHDCLKIMKDDCIPAEGIQSLPIQSIDHALTEKSDLIKMVKATFEWHDVGTWEGLWRSSLKDNCLNFIAGDVTVDNVKKCYIKVEKGKKLVAKNLKNMTIYADHDVLYVSQLEG
ncbi:MAG TPA: sugar phosphate nucleotidyltransferase, partial [Candidatus Nitrosotenuis sp.]|nr:sugar phosphate nucleotidyltransferase [Candidatus Nitrosotenuis sp.]